MGVYDEYEAGIPAEETEVTEDLTEYADLLEAY